MTLNNDELDKGFTCHFKFNIGNLTNVDSSTPKSINNFILMDYIWSKYIMFKPKKSTEKLCLNGNEDGCKIWRKIANFHRLKITDFLLKSKMEELDPIKNYKKSDQPDVVWKLYQNVCENFTLEIN